MPGPELIALAVLLAFTSPSPIPVAGRVIRIHGTDTIAVARAKVILHRVTATAPGPVDSVIADAQGNFRFQITPDSGAVYLVSSRWSGIEYFGPAMALVGDAPEPDVVLTVADTSSTAPIHLAARHWIISPLVDGGVRNVVDLMVLDNPGTITRVGSDSTRASWHTTLPKFAVEIHSGNSDFSVDALQTQADTLGLYAAVPPGQRDIEIDYQIPPSTRRFEVPIDENVPVSNIISQDVSLRVGNGFVRADTTIGGKPYARWQGTLVAGTPLLLEFGGRSLPVWVVPVLIGLMAIVLIFATMRAQTLPR